MIRVHSASVDDKFDGTPVRANDSIIVDEAAGSCALSLLDGGLGYFIIKRCSRAAVQWPVPVQEVQSSNSAVLCISIFIRMLVFAVSINRVIIL